MALRDTVTPRERLYIEAQAARRRLVTKEAADAAHRGLASRWPPADDLDAKSMLGLTIDNGFESASKEPRAHTLEAIALLEEVVAKRRFALRRASIPDSCLRGQQDAREGMACQTSATRASSPTFRTRSTCRVTFTRRATRSRKRSSAFSAAAANEQKWIASDSLYPTGHYGHNVHFLIHALNLGGRYDDSKWVRIFSRKDNRASAPATTSALCGGRLLRRSVRRPLREVE
jgi:hypothetical protein